MVLSHQVHNNLLQQQWETSTPVQGDAVSHLGSLCSESHQVCYMEISYQSTEKRDTRT